MKNFKELGIKSTNEAFTGDKIKMDKILNREIVVHAFKIEDSKYGEGKKKCLYLHISLGGTKHVVFHGSKNLIDLIKQVPENEFPFMTTIVKENERLEFA